MSAFELTREAVEQHDAGDDVEGGPDAVVQADEYIIRESGSAWISAEHPMEVEQ
jgi:hypothetical protein